MLVTKLSTSFQQICQDRLFSGIPYMTLFNFVAIRCASGNAIHISPEVIEFGTVGRWDGIISPCNTWYD